MSRIWVKALGIFLVFILAVDLVNSLPEDADGMSKKVTKTTRQKNLSAQDMQYM